MWKHRAARQGLEEHRLTHRSLVVVSLEATPRLVRRVVEVVVEIHPQPLLGIPHSLAVPTQETERRSTTVLESIRCPS
jgi:hypothetical protein